MGEGSSPAAASPALSISAGRRQLHPGFGSGSLPKMRLEVFWLDGVRHIVAPASQEKGKKPGGQGRWLPAAGEPEPCRACAQGSRGLGVRGGLCSCSEAFCLRGRALTALGITGKCPALHPSLLICIKAAATPQKLTPPPPAAVCMS